VAHGFVIEVEDRGLGMSEAEQAEANELMRNPPDFNLSSTARLGLYVVGRLAQRHEVDVHLRRSPYGGTTAIILIPSALIVSGADDTAARGHLPAHQADVPVPEEVDGGADSTDPPPVAAADPQPVGEPPDVPAPPEQSSDAAADTDADRSTLSSDRASDPAEPVPTGAPFNAPAIAGAPSHTPSGLPWRVRQASLAPGLRDADPAPPDPDSGSGRTPEQTRDMMAAYQRAFLRGRAEADDTASTTDDQLPATDEPTADSTSADQPRH
jgi:hypothetical protein